MANPFEAFASMFKKEVMPVMPPAKKKVEDEDEKDSADDTAEKMEKVNSKEFTSEFSVFKQADDTYRWVGVTSSGFRDRDKELVTTQALAMDVERMNVAKEFGPLAWWHVEFKANDPQKRDPGIALDIASTDMSEMVGAASNIESGVFYDNAVGAAFEAKQKEFGFSRDFWTPINEPNAQGEYSRIHTFRRSILPREAASNLMGMNPLTVHKESKLDKLARFKGIVGEGKANEIIAQIEAREKALETMGVQRKETDVTDEFIASLAKQFASKGEVEALSKAFTTISEAISKFTEGYAASQAKERDGVNAQLSELSAMVKELHGDAPNFLKGTRPSQSKSTEVEATSQTVVQAQQLAAKLKEAASNINPNEPMAQFASFAMPNGH